MHFHWFMLEYLFSNSKVHLNDKPEILNKLFSIQEYILVLVSIDNMIMFFSKLYAIHFFSQYRMKQFRWIFLLHLFHMQIAINVYKLGSSLTLSLSLGSMLFWRPDLYNVWLSFCMNCPFEVSLYSLSAS